MELPLQEEGRTAKRVFKQTFDPFERKDKVKSKEDIEALLQKTDDAMDLEVRIWLKTTM